MGAPSWLSRVMWTMRNQTSGSARLCRWLVDRHIRGPVTRTKAKTRRDHPHRVRKTPGSDLLSHGVTPAVPSAEEGLTTVFGMGTGVSPLL